MVNYYTIKASESLSKYVRLIWVLEGSVAEGDSYIHRTMADGSAELFFHYKGAFDTIDDNKTTTRSATSGVSGPSQKYSRFSISEDFGMFGVYLYPFALQKFFNIPASSLSNQMPDLQTLLKQEGADLEEKMMLAAHNAQRSEIIMEFLEQKLAKNYPADIRLFTSIHHIIKTKGLVKVDDLASQHFLSSRQFERNFKSFSGFNPKLYSRIIRFQNAANYFGKKRNTLTDIAYDCGYYDQSHFIHDFKEFSGYHPKQYFSGKAEGVEWRTC